MTEKKTKAAKLQRKVEINWNKYVERPFAVSKKIEKNEDNRHP